MKKRQKALKLAACFAAVSLFAANAVEASEEGTLSRPERAEAEEEGKLIFIGDSRTEGIRDAVDDDSIWSC